MKYLPIVIMLVNFKTPFSIRLSSFKTGKQHQDRLSHERQFDCYPLVTVERVRWSFVEDSLVQRKKNLTISHISIYSQNAFQTILCFPKQCFPAKNGLFRSKFSVNSAKIRRITPFFIYTQRKGDLKVAQTGQRARKCLINDSTRNTSIFTEKGKESFPKGKTLFNSTDSLMSKHFTHTNIPFSTAWFVKHDESAQNSLNVYYMNNKSMILTQYLKNLITLFI